MSGTEITTLIAAITAAAVAGLTAFRSFRQESRAASREERKDAAILQGVRVIVDVFREQARSYNCFWRAVNPRYTGSKTKVVWNLSRSRIQWICSNNKKAVLRG